MKQERRKGFLYSGLFHFLLILFAIVGLPSILDFTLPEEPQIITVELLPISEMSNVKPSESQPEPKKPEKQQDKQQPKPSPPVKKSDAPPPPPKPSDKKDDKKKPDPKKEEKKPDKKDEQKEKKAEDDLAAILKAVRDTAQKEKKTKEKEQQAAEKANAAKAENYDETMPLSLSEKDAIRSQIAKCWNVPAGAKDAHDLIVVLKIYLEQDGSLIKVELANESKGRYGSDSFFRAAADSAMRAVRQCSPLKSLPPEKFNNWREMELTFNPKDMLF